MHSQRNKLVFSSALIFCAASAHAATLLVPAQYGTTQAAIMAAQPGDVVLLADGTYTGVGNVNLDFGGKSISVTSQNGAAKTIIDCQQQANTEGISFHSGETAAAKLIGVTITNGSHRGGGGVSIAGSSPTLSGCIFSSNYGLGSGGGVSADATSHPLIASCVFAGNTSGSGGGLYAAGQITLTGCTFTGNTASNAGGGAFLANTSSTANTVSGCTFDGNIANQNGGGVYDGASTNSFVNCVFVGNTGGATGGGLAGYAALINCTFTGNFAESAGGAVSGARAITNCILFNDNYNGTGGSEIDKSASTPVVTYSDVQGTYTGTGNTAADPQFARPPSNLLKLNTTPADYGDLHLRMASPLLRSGTTAGAPSTDITGATRPPIPSIGAYETGPTLVPALADSYVLSSAPTQNYGSASTLVVGGFLGTGYVKFDLTSLSPLAASSTIKLRVNAGRAQSGIASLVVAATGSSWTEPSITFNSRPALGLPQGFLNITGGQGSAFYDVDITSYVKAQQALGASQIGLGLTQFTFGSPVSIDSNENSAGDGPQLVVNY